MSNAAFAEINRLSQGSAIVRVRAAARTPKVFFQVAGFVLDRSLAQAFFQVPLTISIAIP
ncbi:hypothetical protein ABZN20_11295 [Methylococcus sp. ANG]|uniref:hypothetical protein n=1 Tax=Methylococcus sp. ANG TaxID=3231903 RepID=UPI003457B903